MNEDFVTQEQAIKLRELGFDWECQGAYLEASTELKLYRTMTDKDWNEDVFDFSIPAPTLAQAQKWLRAVKKEHIIVSLDRWITNKPYRFELYQEFGEELYKQCLVNDFQTYEEALSAGISTALEVIST